MFHVVLDGIVVEGGIKLTQSHVVDTNAVVSKGLSVDVTNSSTNLEELLVLGDGFFEFSKVVVKDTS